MTSGNKRAFAVIIILFALLEFFVFSKTKDILHNDETVEMARQVETTPEEVKKSPTLKIGETLTGSVTRIVDGDSLYVENKKLRLWGVDAPDKDEFGYNEARKKLQEIVQDQTVTCTCKDTDRHGRSMVLCTLQNGDDVGKILIESGWALDYRRHTSGYYEKAEDKAREAKRGLWAPR